MRHSYGAGGQMAGSLLERVRPDLCHLPTTNGDHSNGDGITVALEIGAKAIALKHVQVHPTGLVNPSDPENRTKFLAAEALRGEGGILLDNQGQRFCNDIGKRDYVTGRSRILANFARVPLIFARELCQIAQPPLARGVAAICQRAFGVWHPETERKPDHF
jgi:hypothetical protein